MKIQFNKALAAAGAAMLLALGSPSALAQQQDRPRRGDFDPEQMRQRMLDRVREQLDVKDDAEWKVIQARVQKVLEARRELGGGPGPFGFGRGPGGPPRGDRAEGQDGDGRRRGRGPGGPGFFGPPSPEAEALEQALEAKASADEIKAKLAKLREARKQKEANLEKAQNELKEVLSARQEAQAVLMGLLR